MNTCHNGCMVPTWQTVVVALVMMAVFAALLIWASLGK